MRQVFAPEPAPADFATKGGGLLALRPRNVYASSSDMIAAMKIQDDIESMTRRYRSLHAPVGILFGRSDRILDWRAQGEAMKRELPSLDLEIVEGGHMLPVTQPDVCAAFIRRMAARAPEGALLHDEASGAGGSA
jgi:pimeloyl-ACP methyl ester carboxylesterase